MCLTHCVADLESSSPTDILLLGRSDSAIEKCKSRPNLPESSKDCTREGQKNLPQLAAGDERPWRNFKLAGTQRVVEEAELLVI